MNNHKYLSAAVLLIFGVVGSIMVFIFLRSGNDDFVDLTNFKPKKVNVAEKFTGSLYKGNYVYGAAMNLAWNDLKDNIIHEPIKLNTTDLAALKTTDLFNSEFFTKDDLDEASYYIKSGYGQGTVDQINRESRAKFPDKSFADLDIQLAPKDIIAYAYFLKKVEYLQPFSEDELIFQPQDHDCRLSECPRVKSFESNTDEQRGNVQILKYWDDDKFILSLKLKDNDWLIVAKGFPTTNPDAVTTELADLSKRNGSVNLIQPMGSEDVFRMPKLHLDAHRGYSEMAGKALANEQFKDYSISQMFENIKFDIDQKGARVENEAAIGMGITSVAISHQPKPKYLILDKPFWVIMERKNSQHPYFMLGVNNAELMEKLDTASLQLRDGINAEKAACVKAGGTWKLFQDACGGTCNFVRNRAETACEMAPTYSCECGSGKCWNGSFCESN